MHRRKIAVLRANGLGDFVFALPALQALRESFPRHEIVYLGKALHRELLADRPGPVDRVVVVPPCAGVGEDESFATDRARLERFFSAMRQEAFDVAIQMHGGGAYSNPFLKRLGAGHTLGLRAPGAEALDANLHYQLYYNEILRYLELVSLLQTDVRRLRPRLQSIAADGDAARQVLAGLGRRPYAVLHPGATDIRRRWPAARFAAVADHLADAGFAVYLSGAGEEEGAVAREILARVKRADAVVDASNRLSLRGLLGLLAGAGLMVSNDSGPLHLAEALQVPSVGIYLACNIINAMPMGLGLSRPVVSWTTQCPLCGAGLRQLDEDSGCAHDCSFAADVEVDEVLEAVESLRPHWQ